MRVLALIGTRPEAIKMAPVVRALQARPDRFSRVSVCLSGQHRELTDEVVRRFSLPVDYDLNLMRPGQTPEDVLAAGLRGIGEVLRTEQPDYALFHGDTVTALVAALAAFYARIPSAHVEAGLRTGTLTRPFPEEMHRTVADRICSFCYAPTPQARSHLEREGIPSDRILVTGNTVVDAIRLAIRIASEEPWPEELAAAGIEDRKVVVLTAHRREHFGAPLRRILGAADRLARAHRDCCFLFPAHPNPEVRRAVSDALGADSPVHVIPPLEYGVFARLLQRAALILTDSGGIQEEASVLGVPFVVLREATERPEALSDGLGCLAGTDPDRIIEAAERLLGAPRQPNKMGNTPLGDGRAAERIAAHLAGEEVAPWTPPSAGETGAGENHQGIYQAGDRNNG